MKIVGSRKAPLSALAAAILLGLGIAGYFRYASPTRVAFVNYPEYLLAPLLDQGIAPP